MNNSEKIDLLLSRLHKDQLADFIRKECTNDRQILNRFLALGSGAVFKPSAAFYTSRVEDLIEDFAGRHGYINYRDTFDFNRAVSSIIDEADDAINAHQWEAAVAILSGIADAGDDIMGSGDDSAGELGAIIDYSFQKWHELCANDSLPTNIKSHIFEFALTKFNKKCLKGYDWWWDWIEIAIELADSTYNLNRLTEVLDAIKPAGDDWSSKYNTQTAQRYKLKVISKQGTPDEQRRFMYGNVGNPEFRKRLLQIAWDNGNYDEVLRLAKEGYIHDAKLAGLVTDWRMWEYKVYCHLGDRDNALKLAQHFFFNGARWGDREFSTENMYSKMKELVPPEKWSEHVNELIREANNTKHGVHLPFIYTKEKMWDKYMDYIRKNPAPYTIDEAPDEVKKLYKDEIIQLYATAVRNFLQHTDSRNAYQEGTMLLRKLVKYGGAEEADRIIAEQKARKPRRPALLEELSKL